MLLFLLRRRPAARPWFWLGFGLFGAVLLQTKAALALEVNLKVGIVQRFGQDAADSITVTSQDGSPLELRFLEGNGQTKQIQVPSLTLVPGNLPTNQPQLDEYLVLSDHATFETAEDSARQWRKLGIAVEITQPDRWQVWADRSVYNTPVLRRLLLQSLQGKGYQGMYLASAIRAAQAVVSFSANGYLYNRRTLEIRSASNLFQVEVTGNGGVSGTYSGQLAVQPNAYGSFTLVNQVNMESYLRGVVPYEIGPEAPPAAIEAQSIIARTYALRNLRRFAADDYELCATVHCQVYKGLGNTSTVMDQAIAATKGLVLTYNNELVDALYYSTSGGVTASFEDVWNGGNRPYLKPLIDSPSTVWNLAQRPLNNEANLKQFLDLKDGFNETGRSVFRWQQTESLGEITQDVKTYLQKIKHPLANFTTLRGLNVVKRSPSGRILEMQIQTDRGAISLYKTEVRSAFGPPKSTLFYIEPMYDAQRNLSGYNFVGGGFGHGVGMSQYGSYNLAQRGLVARQILQFYYPGATIKPLDPSVVLWREPPL